jgi:hypothetical protein
MTSLPMTRRPSWLSLTLGGLVLAAATATGAAAVAAGGGDDGGQPPAGTPPDNSAVQKQPETAQPPSSLSSKPGPSTTVHGAREPAGASGQDATRSDTGGVDGDDAPGGRSD